MGRYSRMVPRQRHIKPKIIQEKPVPNKKNAKKGSKEENIKEVLRRRGRRSKRRGNDEVATRIINILDGYSSINLN